jgi:hypothetical protein
MTGEKVPGYGAPAAAAAAPAAKAAPGGATPGAGGIKEGTIIYKQPGQTGPDRQVWRNGAWQPL